MNLKNKPTTATFNKVANPAIETFYIKATFSPSEKRAFLKKPNAFMKRWIKKQGHPVRDCIVDPKLVQYMKARINKSPAAKPLDLLDRGVVVHFESGKLRCGYMIIFLPE
jgi:hypothetical protein